MLAGGCRRLNAERGRGPVTVEWARRERARSEDLASRLSKVGALPDVRGVPRIRRVPTLGAPAVRADPADKRAVSLRGTIAVGALIGLATFVGCTANEQGPDTRAGLSGEPLVFVVAPVINLSGSAEFDALRVTDALASEFLSFPDVSVIPVNLTLAALARTGRAMVETPEEALNLAREFGADATIVTAVTEYDPYDPPVIGLVMQWYAAPRPPRGQGLDPVSASRQASGSALATEEAAQLETAPRWQVQRVFNAAHESIVEEVRSFASQREAQAGPYAWRKYVKSQELFVRYCFWSAIRTILEEDRRCAVTGATEP
jgi:hypothetical protein